MRRLSVLLAGRGKVGAALAGQLDGAAPRLAEERLRIRLAGVASRRALAIEPGGFDGGRWREAFGPCAGDPARQGLVDLARLRPLALIDATAEAGMGDLYREALQSGVHVVSCNKAPFTRSQREYDALLEAAGRGGAYLRFEATAGAGLPTLRTLRDLRQSGDEIAEVSGCFSGTLNFLCAGLDAGRAFSALLREAARLGYTEPDPREDLSGRDVARKALILARLAGSRLEPEKVDCQPLVRTDAALSVEEFMASLERLDAEVDRRRNEALASGKVLRYVARAAPSGASCALTAVDRGDPLARLAGPENVFVFHTRRYQVPLVVSGPGAGPEVTAGGMFSDLLEVARAVAA